MIIDNPSPRHIPALRAIWKQAFGDSEEFLDNFFATGFSCSTCRCVFREGEPAAAVYVFDCLWQEEKVAYLYALAVEKSHQKQGLSRLLLADTHAWLQQQGYRGAVMEPATESLCAYYQRLGYRAFAGYRETVHFAGGEALPFVVLGELGYEQARRKLLPEGGIIQEGVFTRLLNTQAELYGGQGYAAAVSRQGGHILEFLGDPARIPGFLKALGTEKATVRTPIGDKTAVYLDFFGREALPAYFGIPLD